MGDEEHLLLADAPMTRRPVVRLGQGNQPQWLPQPQHRTRRLAQNPRTMSRLPRGDRLLHSFVSAMPRTLSIVPKVCPFPSLGCAHELTVSLSHRVNQRNRAVSSSPSPSTPLSLHLKALSPSRPVQGDTTTHAAPCKSTLLCSVSPMRQRRSLCRHVHCT